MCKVVRFSSLMTQNKKSFSKIKAEEQNNQTSFIELSMQKTSLLFYIRLQNCLRKLLTVVSNSYSQPCFVIVKARVTKPGRVILHCNRKDAPTTGWGPSCQRELIWRPLAKQTWKILVCSLSEVAGERQWSFSFLSIAFLPKPSEPNRSTSDGPIAWWIIRNRHVHVFSLRITASPKFSSIRTLSGLLQFGRIYTGILQ